MTDNRMIGETPITDIIEQSISGRKNVILDSQILTAIMTCAQLTDFRFNHNFQSIKGKSNSLECGSILHKYMEIYYGSIIKGVSKSQAHGFAMIAAQLYVTSCPDCTDFKPYHDPLLTNTEPPVISHICGPNCVTKPKCGHRPNDYPGVKNTPADSEDYKTGWKFVLQTCEEYREYYKNEHWVPLFVEEVKQKVLYEDDEIRILWKSKLDLGADTNQGIYPVDHKTMKQRRRTIAMNNQFKGQCLIMDTRGVFINKIGFQKSLKPEEKFLRNIVPYSAESLLEWQGETLPYWAKQLIVYAEMEYWPHNYNGCEGKYGPCPFLDVCESNPNMRETELRNNFIVGEPWNPTNDEDE